MIMIMTMIIISNNKIGYYTRLVLGISHTNIASCSNPAALQVNFIEIFLFVFKIPILFNDLLDLISQVHRCAITRSRGVNP